MIIITGASKGIGKYLFDEYIKKSTKVYGSFNTTSPSNINNYSKVDITNYSDVQNWINSINKKNNITLINCAGISYNSFAHKAEINKWREVIEVNLIGTFNVIKSILPYMREDGFGRIINFSSVVAQKLTPGASAYAASKSSLWGLSKSIAIENASKGITINNINLGYSELGMIEEVPKTYKDKIQNQIPNGKFCKKDDILKCVEFIRNNSYINGSSIDLNGAIF